MNRGRAWQIDNYVKAVLLRPSRTEDKTRSGSPKEFTEGVDRPKHRANLDT